MKNRLVLTFAIIFMIYGIGFTQSTENTDSIAPSIQINPTNVKDLVLQDFNIQLQDSNGKDQLLLTAPGANGTTRLSLNGEATDFKFVSGKAVHEFDVDHKGGLCFIRNEGSNANKNKFYHLSQDADGTYRVKHIPLWMSIIPPLVAILLALVFKEVTLSLFVGIWSGAFIASGMQFGSVISSFLLVIQKYIVEALTDSGHISVIVFSLLIGGMVAIISRNGGMAGVVKSLSKYARSARSSQFITWLLGVAIFFDDYANTLIVGNTMRSVTDKYKISREKLSYIVDSTAAPVSAVAFITTWIGAVLGYIEGGMVDMPGFDTTLSPYSIFLGSLKYSFYPFMTLLFILILIYTQRDFGPMLKAETRARTTGKVSSATTSDEDEPNMEDLSPVKGAPLKWYNAAIPVMAVIVMTIIGLISTGMDSIYSELVGNGTAVASAGWGDTWAAMGALFADPNASFFMKIGKLIGSSDSYVALLWASLSGVVLAIILTMSRGIMSLFDTMHTMVTGFKTMLPALIILTLAWGLAITTEELHTASYLTSILQDNVSPYIMPSIVFILAAVISFSTGSSWSTMAILYPIAIPTTWAISQSSGLAPDISMEILLNVIAVVLAASVLGDHCSPISDTTILSSLASDCNHIDHVRTQLPYALTVGVFSLIASFVSTYLGGGWLISLILIAVSMACLFGIVRGIGKKVSS